MFKIAATAAVLAIAAAGAAMAAAPLTEVVIDGKNVFNESMHATPDGYLYFGSSGTGSVYRAKPGEAKATLFIDGATVGIKSALGVFADPKSNTLYLCSVMPRGVTPADPTLSQVLTFNLRNGKLKMRYPLTSYTGPDGKVSTPTCNDFDVAKNGDVLIADTTGGRVLKLPKGAGKGIENLAVDNRLRGIDGIALIDNGDLIADTVTTGRLFRITPDGTIHELTPSMKPLKGADGMRSSGGNHVLMSESGNGRITEITIDGDNANMRIVKDMDPGVTGMGLVGDTVWINNGHIIGPKVPPEGPFQSISVPLGR